MTSRDTFITDPDCRSFEIAAYIDGELEPARELEMEAHFADCPGCSAELNDQKQFLCTLDSSLHNEAEIPLPADFTRTIIANAESSVSGLRRPAERFNAIFICAALFFFGLFALAADAAGSFGDEFGKAAAVAGFVVHLASSVVIGFTILVRSVSTLTQLPTGISLFSVVLFAMIFVSLSRRFIRVGRAWSTAK